MRMCKHREYREIHRYSPLALALAFGEADEADQKDAASRASFVVLLMLGICRFGTSFGRGAVLLIKSTALLDGSCEKPSRAPAALG